MGGGKDPLHNEQAVHVQDVGRVDQRCYPQRGDYVLAEGHLTRVPQHARVPRGLHQPGVLV